MIISMTIFFISLNETFEAHEEQSFLYYRN